MNAQPAREPHRLPNYAEDVVDEVRQEIQVELDVIKAARGRRNSSKAAARKYPGMNRTFDSGSIAHATAKNPLPDADGGAVLDRRSLTELGPEGAGVGPRGVVDDVAELVMGDIRAEYPRAECDTSGKRAIVITFHEPIDDEDPRVDLIVALTRGDGCGLWIPNLKSNSWDPSHPEEHTRLLVADPGSLQTYRARLIRLAKVAVEQDDMAVLISFNIETLALYHVKTVAGLAEGLRDLFRAAAIDVGRRDTPDPANVSPPIKLPKGITRESAVKRLSHFGQCVAEAVDHADDEQRVRAALAEVFPEQLGDARSEEAKFADSLSHSSRSTRVRSVLGAGAGGLKDYRSFGGDA